MRQEVAEAGDYFSPGWNRDYPKLQVLTIAELLAGKKAEMPPMRATFARAGRITTTSHQQPAMASLFEDA